MNATAVEERILELDSRGTSGVTAVKVTAVSLALLLAQYSMIPIDVRDQRFNSPATAATASRAMSLEIGPVDLFSQVNRIYDELLNNQIDLDTDSKRALYGNLWNLYA